MSEFTISVDDAREGDNNTFQLGLIMNSIIWLVLALVLVLERLGLLLCPHAQRKTVASLSQLPDNLLYHFDDRFVVAKIVIYYMSKKSIDRSKSGRICLILDAKSIIALKEQ